MRKNPCKVVTQYNFMSIFSQAWYHAMTIPNIVSAFRTTGVCPLNRHAVKVNDSISHAFDGRCPTEATGLAFIPFYSPARKQRPKQLACAAEEPTRAVFTDEEHARFTRKFEEGFDICTDDRYNLWLEIQHLRPQATSPLGFPSLKKSSAESFLDSSDAPFPQDVQEVYPPTNLLLRDIPKPESILKKFLPHPRQLTTKPPCYEKMSAKVLTSAECMKQMEEKEILKQKKEEEKQIRKDERERRKVEKEMRHRATSKGVLSMSGNVCVFARARACLLACLLACVERELRASMCILNRFLCLWYVLLNSCFS